MSRHESRHVGNLPAETTTFVDRRRELADLRRLLSTGRLVTVSGPAGVGKTRLALRAAAEMRPAFPDGAWLVDVAEVRDGRLVPHAVAQSLGIHGAATGRAPGRVLTDYLGERRVLLVLDNCEHVIDGCAEFATTLLRQAGSVRLLMTSREVLAIVGEHVYPVAPLTFPPGSADPGALPEYGGYSAVTLFAERAVSALPGFTMTNGNEDVVGAICRRLEGLPLAIELAATRVRTLSAEQILERLDDRFQVLAAGLRTGLARQRTLRAAVDWSFELCTPQEQMVWARLSVFAGSFALDAAEEVCGDEQVPPDRVWEVLDALVAKSIVDAAERGSRIRYRMLDTLREYGRQRLADAGDEDRLRRRHADWYLALAERGERDWFGPDGMELLTRVRVEHANIRAALDYLLERSAPDAVRLGTGLWFCWTATGPVAEARYWLDRVLATDAGTPVQRAKALWVAGYLAIFASDLERAESLLDQAYRLADAHGERELLAWIVGRRESIALLRGEHDRSVALGAEALARFAEAGDSAGAGAAIAYIAIATSLMFLRDFEAAATASERGRAICQAHGECWTQGLAALTLGQASWQRGDPRRAIEYLREALRLRRGGPQPAALMPQLDVLAWATESSGQFERAAVLHGAVHRVKDRFGLSVVPWSTSAVFVDPNRESLARTRQALGHAAFETAFRHGTELSTDEALSYALGEEPRPDPGTPAEPVPPLTPREREVADLVAAGLSNREIAAQLVISQRTAESHIEHLLTKLGFTSRTQIAAWAVRAGRT